MTLPRSTGSLLITTSPDEGAHRYDISPMSEYSASVSDGGPLSGPNRRSTGASEALQYYWSASAGERSGSVSSSLGMSPIDSSPRPGQLGSPYSLSPHPVLHETKSAVSLRELVQQEAEYEHEQGRTPAPWEVEMGTHLPDVTYSGGSLGGLSGLRERERERDSAPSSGVGQSNRHIHLVSYSSDGSMSGMASGTSVPSIQNATPPSPSRSSLSGESEYSLLEEEMTGATAMPRRNDPVEVRHSRLPPHPDLQSHRLGVIDTNGDLGMGALLDPSFDEWAHQHPWREPGNASPRSPVGHSSPLQSPTEIWSTPTQGAPILRSPIAPVDSWTRSSSPGNSSSDRTPRNSTQSPRTPRQNKSFRPLTSGRLLFVAPPDVSPGSLDALQREYAGMNLKHGGRLGGLSVRTYGSSDESDMPHSAPASRTAFGDIELPGSGPFGRVRPTSLLPPPTTPLESTSSSPRLPQQLAIPSPRSSPKPTIRLSPEPPPKSELRRATPEPPTSASRSGSYPSNRAAVTTPQLSPKHSMAELPTIINTPHTPEGPSRKVQTASVPGSAQSSRSTAATPRTPRSRSTSPGLSPGNIGPLPTSGTIQDLTDILGGAIDEIGLIDSRDTPPPMVAEPSKEAAGSKPLMLANVPPRSTSTATPSTPAPPGTLTSEPAELSPTTSSGFSTSPTSHPQSQPFAQPPQSQPLSQGSVGLGLMGSAGVGAAMAGVGNNVANASTNIANASSNLANTGRQQVQRHVRKASSILSIRSSNLSYGSAPTFSQAGALPTAVVFGNIKALKTCGERARAYSRGVQDLARADSGLRDWCNNAHSAPRVNNVRPKQVAMGQGLGLGLRSPDGAGAHLGLAPPSMRNVSASSEFPTRADAYSAREIMVRNMEPSDEPTALPPNLPYPQLQLNNVKASNSMQSITSVASKARNAGGGLFSSAFGRLKKDKEPGLPGLGPPNSSSLLSLSPSASASKRSLLPPVPASASASSRESLDVGVDSNSDRRVQPSLAVPRGPRGPGSSPSSVLDGTPARSSFDMPRPISYVPARASLDGQTRPNLAGRGSSSGTSSGGFNWSSPGSTSTNTPSPLARGDSRNENDHGSDNVREDDMRQMSDALPHAERPVVRSYLQRYGALTYAMTAYIEDEKQGTLMRV